MNGKKRTFSELRHTILIALLSGQQTTNQISIRTGINWRTVEAHLTFLIGKGLVAEVLKSEYVRIFRLTDAGRQHASSLLQQNPNRQRPIGSSRSSDLGSAVASSAAGLKEEAEEETKAGVIKA